MTNLINRSRSDLHDEHKKYVEDLVRLQDAEGKRFSKALESLLKRIFKVSGGNVGKLLRLMQIIRPKLLKEIKTEVGLSARKARILGKGFGEKKLV